MGSELGKGLFNIIYYNHLFELNKKIENLIKNKSDSYIKRIVNEIASFFMSKKIICCMSLFEETEKNFFE